MKKIILIILCFLCFGCAKEEKNITINIYENSEKELKEEINSVKEENITSNNEKNIEVSDEISNQHNNQDVIYGTSNNASNEIVQKLETNSIKNWYDENKEELKDTSKEILEQDKQTLSNLITNTKNWYDENKKELKDTSKEILQQDKETLNDLYNKIKN